MRTGAPDVLLGWGWLDDDNDGDDGDDGDDDDDSDDGEFNCVRQYLILVYYP